MSRTMGFPSPARCVLVLGLLAAPASSTAALADVTYETAVRIVDSIGRGTADLEETVRTSVTPTARREDVIGSRRMTTRRGRQYQRSGHHVTLDRLDETVVYDLDLDAGLYTKTAFAELARERERALSEAESAFRDVSPDAASDRPVTITRSGERRSVNGIDCSPVRLRVSRETGAAPAPNGAVTGGRARFTMSREVCVTDETDWSRGVRVTQERVRALTGETDAYFGRLLDVLARRCDLFAIFDDLHYRLERERRRLGGLPVHWIEQMTGPQRGDADTVLFRLEGRVKNLRVGAIDAAEFTLPATLKLTERLRER